ncbi:MAG: HAD hydrolase family protein [Gammaproteobacteria bacterium]|nr:HAD hydrolase family protein [Gammaproteobacteria bacterium]
MNNTLSRRLAAINLLVLDVDGVLTDGRLLYGAQGEIGKSFNVKDGFGMRRLMQNGVSVAVISARRSEGALVRFTELGLTHIYLGCRDKQKQIRQLQKSLAVERDATAVVGDDVPDLDMMAEAGLAIAVADAAREIQDIADWTTDQAGGQGAVREVCDAIIAARQRA